MAEIKGKEIVEKQNLVSNFKEKWQKLNTEHTLNDMKHNAGTIGRSEWKENKGTIHKRRKFLMDFTDIRMRVLAKRENDKDSPVELLIDQITREALPKLNPMDDRRITTGVQLEQDKLDNIFNKGETNELHNGRADSTSGEDEGSKG